MHLKRVKQNHPPHSISKVGTLLALIVINVSLRNCCLVHGAKEQPEDIGLSRENWRLEGAGDENSHPPKVISGKNNNEEEEVPFLVPCSPSVGGSWSCPISQNLIPDYHYTDNEEENENLDSIEPDKRTFNPWGGKRTFNPWGGKRTFNPWGGKRSHFSDYYSHLFNQPFIKKGVFNPWGGKRDEALKQLISNSRSSKNDYPSRRIPFNPWGGRR